MSSNSDTALLIFAKSPSFADVKTRLRSVLSSRQRTSLHVALLQDAIEKARSTNFPTYLYLTSPDPLPFFCDLPIMVQNGKDLGERMFRAVAERLPGYEKVIIIGTDSPTFGPGEILDAASALDENDVVLGPCEDGGYYLIAMKEAIKEAYLDVPWGTAKVLKASLRALSKYRVHLLSSCYDVDRPEDLVRLRREVASGSYPHIHHTRIWLQASQS